MFVEFLLSLFAFLYRTLSADTSGQTPHDICNFNSYALNYLRRSFRMTSLCLFGAVGRPHLYSSKGSFYFYIIGSSLLWNHSPSEWFSTYNQNHQLNWWFAPSPGRAYYRQPLKRHRKVCQSHFFYRPPLKRPVIMPLYS